VQADRKEKARICWAFAEPSDGLEPSTPSLPCAPRSPPLIAVVREIPVNRLFCGSRSCASLPFLAVAGFQTVSEPCASRSATPTIDPKPAPMRACTSTTIDSLIPRTGPPTRSLYGAALLAAVLPLVAGCGKSEASPAHPGTATVSGVSGDVIRLADGRSVRLRGIDAPTGTECHAVVSERLLARILPPGTRVRLAGGYVFKDRSNVNITLVRRGAASAYFVRPPGRYADVLLRAARQARAARRGAWGGCAATLDPAHGWRLRRRAPDRIVRKG
jgi:endonuclease YncB( thermonuclease family)